MKKKTYKITKMESGSIEETIAMLTGTKTEDVLNFIKEWNSNTVKDDEDDEDVQ